MRDDPDPIDPDFVAKPPKGKRMRATRGPQAVPFSAPVSSGGPPAPTQVEPPTVFDEERIRQELQEFVQNPTVFAQYVHRLRNRFTKSGEVAFINHWVRVYESSRRLIETRTDLERANIDYQQLIYEDELKRMEKDTTLEKLKADTEEQKLRAARARFKRQNIENYLQPDTPIEVETTIDDADTKKFNAARDKRRKDIQWKISETLGNPVATMIELQTWRKTQREKVLKDRTVSQEERQDLLDFIETLYKEGLEKLTSKGNVVFEDD